MLASKHGHAKCVQLLLEKEADIQVVSDRGYNCLMEAIERGHKYAVVVNPRHTHIQQGLWYFVCVCIFTTILAVQVTMRLMSNTKRFSALYKGKKMAILTAFGICHETQA